MQLVDERRSGELYWLRWRPGALLELGPVPPDVLAFPPTGRCALVRRGDTIGVTQLGHPFRRRLAYLPGGAGSNGSGPGAFSTATCSSSSRATTSIRKPAARSCSTPPGVEAMLHAGAT